MTRTDIALLAALATVAAIAILAGNTLADPRPSCIDPAQSYVARPLNSHEIWVQNSLGERKPPVRLTTSCYHLQSAVGFGLSAVTRCIGKGDTVVANLIGDHQSCVVTKIVPYAPQDGDLPEKK